MGFGDKIKKIFGRDKKENEDFKPQKDTSLNHDFEEVKSHDDFDSESSKRLPNTTNDERNFKYLDNLIHGGATEIVLDSDIILNDDEESQYVDGIEIDVNDLVIDGNNNAIDACGKTRIFKCSGKNIVLKNITFKNGFNVDGGAIFNQGAGELVFDNCVFSKNASREEGGAIINWGKIKGNNVDFIYNTAKEKSSGAISNQTNGEVILDNCVFTKNSSQKEGGALANWGNLIFHKCKFNDNSSKTDVGGAIVSWADVNLNSCDFIGNFSKKSGGAISIQKGALDILGGEFKSNVAENAGGAMHNSGKIILNDVNFLNNVCKVDGGAIVNLNEGILEIDDCYFKNNVADDSGGAIINLGSVHLTNTNFDENIAKENGGVIFTQKDTIFDACDCSFNKNVAEKSGGVLASYGDVNFENCSFNDNSSKTDVGGAIVSWAEVNLNSCVFIGNFSKKSGGAVSVQDGILDIESGEFRDNACDNAGGAIISFGEIKLNKCNLLKNSAAIDGGAILNFDGCTLNASRCEFSENAAEQSGGAIFNLGRGNLKQCKFIKNITKGFGGTINSKNDDDLVIEDCEFVDNINFEDKLELVKKPISFKQLDELIHSGLEEILLDCDVVLGDDEESQYSKGIKLDVDDLVIDGNGYTIDACGKTRIFKCNGKNIALKNITLKNGYAELGGAIYNNDELSITELTFINCIANKKGGAIFNEGNELFIKNSSFSKNMAKGKSGGGGAIFNTNCKLTITDSKFSKNIANGESRGGGGVIRNENGTLTIIKSKFTNNKAKWDGGVLYNKKGDLSIVDSIFNTNVADKNAGAIRNDDNMFTLKKSKLLKNTSQFHGGAICNRKGKLAIHDSILNENTAQGEYSCGGAIYNQGEGQLTITKSTLQENTAHNSGGAIYNTEGGRLTITKSTLNNNTTQKDGGAIDNFFDCELTITESTLIGNTAQNGGAIYNWKGELTITDSILQENTAEESGGAIHNTWGGRLTITDSILQENIAQDGGGAIHNNKGNFMIFNCEFSSNKSPNNIILNNDSLQIHNAIFKDNQSKFIVLNDGDGSNLGIFNGEFSENKVEESVLSNTGRFCSVEKTIFENNISNNTMNIINKSELTLTNPQIKDTGKSILNQNYILIKKSPPELENIIYGEGTVEVDEKIIPPGENFDFGYLDKKIHESKTKEIILDHDITFENYERDFYEGGIELDIDDLIINGNGHTIDGVDKSRIFIITGKNITLKNIIFKNGHSYKNYDNSLNTNGGAIKNYYNTNTTIENCEFINNASEENGGAIYNSMCDLTIHDSKFYKNTAQRSENFDGGAIYNWKGTLTIHDSTLQENIGWKGGAIYNWNGEITITESELTGSPVQKVGGAIHNNGGEITITKSTLNNHTTAIENINGEITIAKSTLNSNNRAIWNEGRLTISESTLNNNTAVFNGGAIYNSKGRLTITDSTFIGNMTQERSGKGGAIYINKGKLTITDSTFIGNTAQEYGGAIYAPYKSQCLAENCTFKDNQPNDF